MEQRNSARPEPRRHRLAHGGRGRKETIHVLVIPPTEMPKHRTRILNGPSTPPIHRTEPARDPLHELPQANGVVQGRLDLGERQTSAWTEHGG